MVGLRNRLPPPPAAADNGEMEDVLHAVCALAYVLCIVLGTRFWLISVVYGIRAAANRRPGIGWHRAMRAIVFDEEVYTQTGENLAQRARDGCAGFFLCWLLAAIAGVLAASMTPGQ